MTRMSASMPYRPLRAGLVAAAVVAGFLLGYGTLSSSPACDSSEGGCLGYVLLAVALGLPVAVGLVAWGLKGKGFVHAVLGSVVSLFAGWRLTVGVMRAFGWTPPDTLGALAAASVIGALAGLWAAYGPAARRRGDPRRLAELIAPPPHRTSGALSAFPG